MIKHIRESLGLSQAELANEMGVTQGAISHIEIGRTSIKKQFADKLIDVSKSYGIEITYNDIFGTRAA